MMAVSLVDLNGLGPRSRGFNPAGLRMRPLSEELLGRLDEDALEILDKARADVEEILGRIGPERILRLARLLLERETMLGREFGQAAAAVREEMP
jgi:hypothetical protein